MMKATKLFYSALATCLLCGITPSCSDDNDLPGDLGTPVNKIEAFINFDLSARADWTLSMGGCAYDFEVDGSKLSAIPKNEPYRFSAGQTTTNGATEVILRPPSDNTRMALNSTPPPPPPTEADQSTPEKLASYDMLIGRYIGNVKEELTNLRLTHYYALLDFKVSGLPQDAEVFIIQDHYQTITPLRDATDKEAYKAIVWSSNTYEEIEVIVKTASKTYNKVLREPVKQNRSLAYHFDGIGNGSLLNFTARINTEDELMIEDLAIEGWADEWPLNQ